MPRETSSPFSCSSPTMSPPRGISSATSTRASPCKSSWSSGDDIEEQLDPWLRSITSSQFSGYGLEVSFKPGISSDLKHPQSVTSHVASDSELIFDSALPGFPLDLPTALRFGGISECLEPPAKRRRCGRLTIDENSWSVENSADTSTPLPELRPETFSADIRQWLQHICAETDGASPWKLSVDDGEAFNANRGSDDDLFEQSVQSGVPSHFLSPALRSFRSASPVTPSMFSHFSPESLSPLFQAARPPASSTRTSSPNKVLPQANNSSLPEFSYVKELLRSSAETWNHGDPSHCRSECNNSAPEKSHGEWPTFRMRQLAEIPSNGESVGSHSHGSPKPPTLSNLAPTPLPDRNAVEQICSTVFDKLRAAATPGVTSDFGGDSVLSSVSQIRGVSPQLGAVRKAVKSPTVPDNQFVPESSLSSTLLQFASAPLQELASETYDNRKTNAASNWDRAPGRAADASGIAAAVMQLSLSSKTRNFSPLSFFGIQKTDIKEGGTDEEEEIFRKLALAATPLLKMADLQTVEATNDLTDPLGECPATAFLKTLDSGTSHFPSDPCSTPKTYSTAFVAREPRVNIPLGSDATERDFTSTSSSHLGYLPDSSPERSSPAQHQTYQPLPLSVPEASRIFHPVRLPSDASQRNSVGGLPYVIPSARIQSPPRSSVALTRLSDPASDEGFQGEDGLWYKRPDIDDKCLSELCDLSELGQKETNAKLFVEYKDSVNFPLGEGGRELLRACLNAKGCKGRRLQGASVPMLLRLAKDWGLWNVAVRIKVERATGELCSKHEAFVRFKAMQSHLRKFLKREQMHTERDISGHITDIRFEEMKSLTLGKEGREKLRTQLRRLHDRDPHRMDTLLEQYGFKYSELRNATVPQLLKMAHVCCMWDEVIDACKQQEAKRDTKATGKKSQNSLTVGRGSKTTQQEEFSSPTVTPPASSLSFDAPTVLDTHTLGADPLSFFGDPSQLREPVEGRAGTPKEEDANLETFVEQHNRRIASY